MGKQSIKQSSLCVKEYKDNRSTKPHQLPIYATSSFEFESIQEGINIFTGEKHGHVYGRYGNPTIDTVAKKIADLESYGTGNNAWGLLTSSGMSAISTIIYSLLKQGDKILTQGNLYGGTTELFSKIISNAGIECIYTDLSDSDNVESIISKDRKIRLVYLETPANPTMACIDIKVMAALAKKYGIISCIDNTFCTPIIQQPLKYGVDIVIHSTTKYLNGHGNSIAGAIVGMDTELYKKVKTALKLIGSTCNPFDAWLLNNGLKTLSLRMEKHSSNAKALADALSLHPKVKSVNYNGLTTNKYHHIAIKQMSMFGGMLSFELDNQFEALKCIDKLDFCSLAPTLGDTDTLVLHPATSSHLHVPKSLREENGISDGLIRVSVGIEDASDIIADFMQALDKL